MLTTSKRSSSNRSCSGPDSKTPVRRLELPGRSIQTRTTSPTRSRRDASSGPASTSLRNTLPRSSAVATRFRDPSRSDAARNLSSLISRSSRSTRQRDCRGSADTAQSGTLPLIEAGVTKIHEVGQQDTDRSLVRNERSTNLAGHEAQGLQQWISRNAEYGFDPLSRSSRDSQGQRSRRDTESCRRLCDVQPRCVGRAAATAFVGERSSSRASPSGNARTCVTI